MPEFNLTALKNLGNTCYMNSAIHALFATEEFLIYILDNKCDKKLHSSLRKLFNDMIDCGEKDEYNDCISPQQFRDVFVETKPEFNNHNQQDSQEFIRLLIDGIHEEVNEAKDRKRPKTLTQPKTAKESWIQYNQYIDDSFLVKLFVGQLSSTIECMECSHQSNSWDTFWDISLSIPDKLREDNDISIKNLMDCYFEDEVLDNDSMVNCDKCNAKRKSKKIQKIERLPLILTINLKRFGNNGQKLSKNIDIDETLILNDNPYELYACICHRGESVGGGHYNVFCRYYSQFWYLFDDSTIERFDRHVISGGDSLKGAYILFYHLNDVSIKS